MKEQDENEPARPDADRLADDRVAALLRLTGPRPAPPAERAVRVREAVRAHWRATVAPQPADGGRARAQWPGSSGLRIAALAAAVLVVLVLAVGVWLRRAGTSTVPAGRIEVAVGEAWAGSAATGGPVHRAQAGLDEDVMTGYRLATGRDGRLAIRLASGHSVRLDAATSVRIDSPTMLALERGAVYVDSGGPRGAGGRAVEIGTPFGTVLETGTQFEVRAAGGLLRVRVREGAVSCRLSSGGIEVAAGREVAVDGSGQVKTLDLTSYGAEWDWIGAVTPPMTIEGRTLREFLDWCVREKGLRLESSTPGLLASASTIVLNGSIAGMTTDQALASVLPTCQMTHRIDGSRLLIEPARGTPAL